MWNWSPKRKETRSTGVRLTGDLLDSPSLTGERITEKNALGIAPIWRGVNLISSKVASIPLCLYKRGPDDSREHAKRHPAHKLLKRQSNFEGLSAYHLKQLLTSHAILHGGGFAAILRDDLGNPVELFPLDPESTYPVRENGKLFYATTLDNRPQKLFPENVLHIRSNMGPDGLTSYGIIALLKDSLGLSKALTGFQAAFFRNNARPNLVIEIPRSLTSDEDIERFRRTWGNAHSGISNSHRPALLENGATVTPLPNALRDLQVKELTEQTLIDCANILQLPPHMLGAKISTSFSSLEIQQKSFLTDSLNPYLHCWENECWQKLLTKKQQQTDALYFEFNREAVIELDHTTKINSIIQQLNNGLLTENQALQLLNLPTFEEGDRRRIPAQILYTDDVRLQATPEEPQATPEAPAEEPEQQPDERLHKLTEATVKRLVERVTKAIERKNFDVEKHRDIFVESLTPITDRADEITQSYFDDLHEELNAALPEQVIQRQRAETPKALTAKILGA